MLVCLAFKNKFCRKLLKIAINAIKKYFFCGAQLLLPDPNEFI
jgi:hypothetical protein